MKLNAEPSVISDLTELATSLMGSAASSNNSQASDEANKLARRMLAIAGEKLKELESAKTVTENELAHAIGRGKIPLSSPPEEIARLVFVEIYGQATC